MVIDRLPETLTSIKVQGKSVWSRPSCITDEHWQGTGIRFENLGEPYLSLITEYSLSKLYDDNFVRQEGIIQVLNDIRNLAPQWRLKAYNILIKRGASTCRRTKSLFPHLGAGSHPLPRSSF